MVRIRTRKRLEITLGRNCWQTGIWYNSGRFAIVTRYFVINRGIFFFV